MKKTEMVPAYANKILIEKMKIIARFARKAENAPLEKAPASFAVIYLSAEAAIERVTGEPWS